MDTNRHEFIEKDEIQITNDELNPNDEITSRVETASDVFVIRASILLRHLSFIFVIASGVHSWYFAHLSRHMNHQPQIEKQKRRGKK